MNSGFRHARQVLEPFCQSFFLHFVCVCVCTSMHVCAQYICAPESEVQYICYYFVIIIIHWCSERNGIIPPKSRMLTYVETACPSSTSIESCMSLAFFFNNKIHKRKITNSLSLNFFQKMRVSRRGPVGTM